MSERITVRALAEGDLEAVVAIEKQVLSSWDKSQIVDELQFSQSIVVSAEVAGELAGWCCCRYEQDEAELLKLTVAEKWPRLSVATTLLSALESELRKLSAAHLFLEVRSENLAALAFYAEAGFTATGRRINYYSQPSDDALVLRKTLSTPSHGSHCHE